MSYSSKNRYKTRRERAAIINKNVKRALFFFAIAFAVWLFRNRVGIIDYFKLYFY